jgi:predicted choloylglycine hydrolase
VEVLNKKVIQRDSGLFILDNNWFRKSESGLHELYVEGSPFERGVAIGALTKELVQYQEKVFNDQIHNMIPSHAYLKVLKYFVGWFNRALPEYVSEEYQLEIYGISQVSSAEYNNIAEPYQRILNYHAAHDIGHALQNMSLVGCTSFASWGNASEDSTLIIGRNFDFYVGDDFARNKIVAFYKPEQGHKFMMITFGGMAGVLSGMNTEGLTVTINAAKSDIPSSAATPVSLVAREILQYAATIEEAYAIAKNRKMFVSESFLIGSAKDGRAAIIEKSNTAMALYDPQASQIICTNHFQSSALGNTTLNQKHVQNSASAYRFKRVEELLKRDHKNTIEKTVAILRDQKGMDGRNIGLGNEKSINQLVAHHGIVFQPEKKLVWISTAPWQLGKFVCYDLGKVFDLKMTSNEEIYEMELEIKSDSFLLTSSYHDFLKISKYRFPFSSKDDLNPDSIVRWNPDSYLAHMLAGDFYFHKNNYTNAVVSYENALTKEIATMEERKHIQKNLAASREKLQ